MLNEAVKQSAFLAKEYGTYEKYNEKALFKSSFFIKNVKEDVKDSFFSDSEESED